MLLFRRPVKPRHFDRNMTSRRERVEALVRAGKVPSFEDDVWRSYKDHFTRVQHGKCGYCEAYVLATGTGTVEHFRPKADLSELLEEGHERPGTSNVEGRRIRSISGQGYWWLAYEWTNWLFVCERCNSGWKRTLFPVADKPRRELPPVQGAREESLLLNPFERRNPGNHLRFDDLGQISAVDGSRIGIETIRTLGLYRESLRKPRFNIAKRVYELVDQILPGLAKGQAPDPSVAEELLSYGQVEASHAGMVRILFEQEVPVMAWSELEKSSPTFDSFSTLTKGTVPKEGPR